jgi:N-acetylmuramoyl-L-alanine amidase
LKTILKAFVVFVLYGANISLAATIEHTYKSVYIDPFYGGKDNGPIIANSYKAKELTLNLAKQLQQQLKISGSSVFLSRDKDNSLTSDMRSLSAKSHRSDVYIAIRVSYHDNDCISLYHLKSHSTKPKTTDDRNSFGDIFKALELYDLAFESNRLANVLANTLKKDKALDCVSMSTRYNDDEVFYVLTNSPCPVVIIDFGISKTAKDNPYFLNSEKSKMIINSISEAIAEFMKHSIYEIN